MPNPCATFRAVRQKSLLTRENDSVGACPPEGGSAADASGLSRGFYPDEGPVHAHHVQAFAIEQHPVTNAKFSQFVSDTGYVTVAEQPLDPALFLELGPEELCPGALVFTPTPGPVDLSNWAAVVALVGRCRLAASVRPRIEHCGRSGPPGGPIAYPDTEA